MKIIAKSLLTVGLSLAIISSGAKAFAQELGYIDVNKILTSYSKAVQAEKSLKTKEDELKAFIVSAQKEIKAAKSESDSKALEEKHNKTLQERATVLKQEQLTSIQAIRNNLLAATKTVAAKKRLTTVLNRDSIVIGGVDLTDEIITELNSKY
ncbi:MAG: OmpH family outer membrane protein [Bacillus subtilis]|nr:OmpH family outer membrane protein [Bacillus subtilis]